MYKQGVKRKNPWERVPAENPDYYTPDVMHYLKNLAAKRPMFLQIDENTHLDVHTKRAALKASPSVVSLVSYSGEDELYQSSGTIIERDANNRCFILTSAKLIRRPTEKKFADNNVAENLKLYETLWDNVGHLVEVVVARAGHVTLLHLKMMVAEAPQDQLNSWPHRKYR